MNLQEELKQLGHKSDTTSGELICFIFELCGVIKNLLSYAREHSNLQEKILIAICKSLYKFCESRPTYDLPESAQ